MPVADILQLGAAGNAGGTFYFVATYQWTGASNVSAWGSIVYDPADDLVYSSVHFNISGTNYEPLVVTDLTSGDCVNSRWYNGQPNYGSARNMHTGVNYLGQDCVLQFARYDSVSPRVYNIANLTTIPTYQQNGYNYFYGAYLANSIMGHQGRPYAFGGFTSYDTPAGYILMPYEVGNTATNKLQNFQSNRMGWNDARLMGTDQVAVVGVTQYQSPRVMKITLNSNEQITAQVSMAITNMGTDYNNQYASPTAYRPTDNVSYVATSWGICPVNFTTMTAHATYTTGRQMPTNVPNTWGAPSNDVYYIRVAYDPINDRIYLCRNYWAIALSPDLSTIYWYITGNFTQTCLVPKGDEDGNVIFSAKSNNDGSKFVIAQLDKDASQVPTTDSNPIAGVYWKRGTSGVTMASSAVTTSYGLPSFTFINTGSLQFSSNQGTSATLPNTETIGPL